MNLGVEQLYFDEMEAGHGALCHAQLIAKKNHYMKAASIQ
jgi:hypothetical protein